MDKSALTNDALDGLEKFIQKQLLTQLKRGFSGLDVDLLDEWPKLKVLQDRMAARDAHRWLRKNQKSFYVEVMQNLLNRLFKRAGDSSQMNFRDLNFLTIMDEDGLNLGTVRTRSVQRLLDTLQTSYAELNSRLAIVTESTNRIDSRALGPGAIVEVIIAALSGHGVTTQVQAALVAALPTPFTHVLADLYVALNERLAQMGILPQLPITNVYSAQKLGDLTKAQMAQIIITRSRNLKHDLDQLPGQEISAGKLKNIVDTHFDPASHAELSHKQLRTISQVEAWYLGMISNEQSSVRFRAEFKRLLPAMLTLRLVSPKRFEGPHSPVRAFLQQLAVLGSVDHIEPLADFSQISSIVDRVVMENGLEPEGFRAGSQALYTVMQHMLTGNDGAKDARNHIIEIVEQDIKGLDTVPTQLSHEMQRVCQYMLKPWMMACYTGFGQDSKAGISALVSAHMFFGALSDRQNTMSPAKLKAWHEDVLRDANDWAEHSLLSVADTKSLLDEIEQELSKRRHASSP